MPATRLCLCLLLACAGVLNAADLPLGHLTAIEDGRLHVAFVGGHRLAPTSMLAVYGPGRFEKHPLTGQVIREEPVLVARAQVLSVDEASLQARITWQAEGVVLQPGFDVLPTPGEAVPDSPPVLSGPVSTQRVTAQGRATITLPVRDPEGGPLGVLWSLRGGVEGARGRLSESAGGRLAVEWDAPWLSGELSLHAVVVDRVGQTLEVELPLEIVPYQGDLRARELEPRFRLGPDQLPGLSILQMAAGGQRWGVTSDGRSLVQVQDGWQGHELIALRDLGLRGVDALATAGQRLLLLDASGRQLLICSPELKTLVTISDLQSPSDVAVDLDGLIYIADQGQGGIAVYEPTGAYRCRLGRAGSGADAFQQLGRLTVDRRGTVFALDLRQRSIQRFDRFHRRLPTWTVPDEGEAVDLAAHPLGLVLLMADGSLRVLGEDGELIHSIAGPAASGLVDRLDAAHRLSVDHAGVILATFPRSQVLARWWPDGSPGGILGTALIERMQLHADGRGRILAYEPGQRLFIHDAQGWRTQAIPVAQSAGGMIERPGPLAVSKDGGLAAVLDLRRYAVGLIDLDKPDVPPLLFGQRGSGNGQFEDLSALSIDGQRRIYVADRRNRRISVFTADGQFSFRFGEYERGRNPHEIQDPAQIAVTDAGDMLFIYDRRLFEVQKFRLDHEQATATHVTNAGGRGNSLGQFRDPVEMLCDRAGLLYVADGGRNDLQVIDFRGNMAHPLAAVPAADHQMRGLDGMALSPDGLPMLTYRGQMVALGWRPVRAR